MSSKSVDQSTKQAFKEGKSDGISNTNTHKYKHPDSWFDNKKAQRHKAYKEGRKAGEKYRKSQ